MTQMPKPSRERLSELFVRLARIPSPSRSERAVADAVMAILGEMGITVKQDGTGRVIGGDCGNLVCTVGEGQRAPSLALGAHLDTVPSLAAMDPVLDDDGIFRNKKQGILGADDKGAIAALLHATEILLTSGRPFPTYELFFTVCEEDGLVGAKHLAAGMLRSPMAAVLDSSGPVGGVVTRAPSQKIIRARYRGVAAHAGLEPELGRSAVQAAAKAIAAMNLGRLDSETTANIGTICGGVATNIVPDACELAGECRGHEEGRLADVAAGMVDALHQAAVEVGVDVDVDLIDEFRAFRLAEDSAVVRLATSAVAAAGFVPELQTAGGGSDANILNAQGIPTVNLAAGMMRVHSADEHVSLDELERLCRVVIALVEAAGGAVSSGDEGHDHE
jgi:tripeptide aminopeptidase